MKKHVGRENTFFLYSLPFDSQRKREREGAEWKTNRYVMTDIEYDYEASRLIDTIGIIYTITESETVLSLPIAKLSPVSATSRWIIIMTRRFTVRASESGFRRRDRRVTINENSLIRYPSDIEAAANSLTSVRSSVQSLPFLYSRACRVVCCASQK